MTVTMHALPEDCRRSFQAGCNAHLTKPIDKNVLLAAIGDWAIEHGDDSVQKER